jgi:hypothetical protein
MVNGSTTVVWVSSVLKAMHLCACVRGANELPGNSVVMWVCGYVGLLLG